MGLFFNLTPFVPLFPLLAFAAIILLTHRNSRLSSNIAIGGITLSTVIGWGMLASCG